MNRLLPLTLIALLLLAPAARGGELDAEEQAVEQAAAEIQRIQAQLEGAASAEERAGLQAALDAARTALEATRAQREGPQFEAAKRAFEDAWRRLRARTATVADLQTRIRQVESILEAMRANGLSDDVTAKQKLAELERLKSALANAAASRDEALDETITDQHPEPIRLRREIEQVKKQLAALEEDEEHRVLRVRTDEDGRFVLLGDEADEDAAYLLVDGDLVVRGRLTTGEDAVVTEPKVVEKTVRRTLRWAGPHANSETRKRIDHLRQAAKHLREAGQAEEAERLEKQAKTLEASLSRYTVTVTDGAGSERVLKAIGDLRQEVQALRQEVRELKALLLEDR